MRRIPLILLALGFAMVSVASETLVMQPIPVGEQIFTATLTTFGQKRASKFIVAAMGTGVYCAQKNIPKEFADVAARHSTAILTVEKPGINCSSTKPVSREVFARHTRSDVVLATALAIDWAQNELHVKAPAALWGHSEGAQVMANVLRDYFKNFAGQPIAFLITSPAMDFRELINFQVADIKTREKFLDSIKRKDDGFLLKSTNGNISAAYWESILADESLAVTLERNLIDESHLEAALFWGTEDTQCSANSTCSVFEKLKSKFPQRVNGTSFPDGHSIENHLAPIAKQLDGWLRNSTRR